MIVSPSVRYFLNAKAEKPAVVAALAKSGDSRQ
jgi:hypothetical protein